jgi:hypothetical protein
VTEIDRIRKPGIESGDCLDRININRTVRYLPFATGGSGSKRAARLITDQLRQLAANSGPMDTQFGCFIPVIRGHPADFVGVGHNLGVP